MTISVDLVNSRQVADALASISPKMRRGTTAAIVREGAPIVLDAKSNAEWSSRIPGAIKMTTKYGGRFPGIYVRVDSAAAPHARGYEDVTGRGEVRHPVFGVWRENVKYAKSRPFIAPAIRSGAPRVRAGIEQAISDALRV